MTEKRFICGLGFPINSDDPICIISDSVEDKDYYKFSDICNVLNEQHSIIRRDETSIQTMMSNMEKLEKENEQLRKEKEYYREYALQYLLEYEFYSDNFLNTIKNTISEEEVKKIKEEENKIIEALKKEGLYG